MNAFLEAANEVLHGALLLLAVVNPIGNLPIYVHLTQHMTPAARRKTFDRAVLAALCITTTFALVGDWSLRNVFEVSLEEFKIAGGILLFVVAARGVLQTSARYRAGEIDERAMAVFPLAFPIIVGPGSLALTIILSMRYGAGRMVVITVVVMAITYALVHASHTLMRVLGPYVGQTIARLLYLFLAGKAVSLTLSGLVEYGKQVGLP